MIKIFLKNGNFSVYAISMYYLIEKDDAVLIYSRDLRYNDIKRYSFNEIAKIIVNEKIIYSDLEKEVIN